MQCLSGKSVVCRVSSVPHSSHSAVVSAPPPPSRLTTRRHSLSVAFEMPKVSVGKSGVSFGHSW